jgi:hypothetical protein
MIIGILGMGMVGEAVHDVMRDIGHQTVFYDPKFTDSKIEDVLSSEIIYICVPTKPGKDNKCDLTILHSVLEELHKLKYEGVICIKSTILPGTTDALISRYRNENICFCPEFLRERCAYDDYRFRNPICVIGTISETAFKKISSSHAGVSEEFKKVRPKEAELTKYFQNVYNTNRILFANAFFEVCLVEDVDYDSIIDSLLKRKEMDDRYLRCNENLRGPSGPCLVKDTLAFRAYVGELNLSLRPKHFEAMVHDLALYPRTVIDGTRSEEDYFGQLIGKEKSDEVVVTVPISVGDLFDKLTILQIKENRITNVVKRENVLKELNALSKIKEELPHKDGAKELFQKLLDLNKKFWEYHDWQRVAWEQVPIPQEDLLRRGREEHMMNDERARLKKKINILFNSEITEEKQFIKYDI